MRKIKNIIFEFVDNTYNMDLLLVIGDYKYFQKEICEKYKIDPGIKSYNPGYAFYMENGAFIKGVIWLEEFDWRPSDYGLFSHELLHHCNNVMKVVGIKIKAGNDEPLAYYYSNLFERILKHLLKFSKSKRKTINA